MNDSNLDRRGQGLWRLAWLLLLFGCDDLDVFPSAPEDAQELGADLIDDKTEDSALELDEEVDEGPDATFDQAEAEQASPPLTLLERLEAIPGMVVVGDWRSDYGGHTYDLRFRQPVDHNQPEGAQFDQVLSLLVRRDDLPMNLVSTGYDDYLVDYPTELTELLFANQLVVEHRYFGASTPDPLDWQYLTVEQAAADHHRIVQALAPLFTGPWVSSGASKGGMTSVFHRRFYPDDVLGTVAYVAPITFAEADPRYVDFLAAIPEPACQAKLLAIQNEALRRRDALALELSQSGWTFTLVGGEEAAVDTLVMSLPFTFWQYSGVEMCGSIPDVSVSDHELFLFLNWAVGADQAADVGFEYFAAYYYQAHTELGYPDLSTEGLVGLLPTPAPNVESGVLPAGVDPVYSDAAMLDVARWVEQEGSQLMFVYGEHDPWTAGAFELGGAVDSVVYTVPQGTHAAELSSLPAADRAAAFATLEAWTGVTVGN